MSFDTESVNSTDYEEPLRESQHRDFNTDNKFETFILVDLKDSAFDDNLSTSFYLEHLIVTASNETNRKLDGILNEETTSLTAKSFATTSGELYSEDSHQL